MSFSPLDPNEVVILFADLQAGILERSATLDPAQLRKGVAGLAQLAKIFAIPVVVTTAPVGPGAPQVTPEIATALGDLPPNVRHSTNAFLDTPTRQAIEQTGRPTLLISGVATEIIVQHSALSALTHGLRAQVVMDACGGLSARTEAAAIARLVHAGVVTTSVASVAGQLAGDLSQPKGQQALGVLMGLRG
jgi:nicotinamidase-related amidase